MYHFTEKNQYRLQILSWKYQSLPVWVIGKGWCKKKKTYIKKIIIIKLVLVIGPKKSILVHLYKECARLRYYWSRNTKTQTRTCTINNPKITFHDGKWEGINYNQHDKMPFIVQSWIVFDLFLIYPWYVLNLPLICPSSFPNLSFTSL